MKIRVIDKQTGQTGTLPEENFDPVKYTKIGDASVVAQKPTTLGNIPQFGPSDVLAQADIAKEKADKKSDTEKKIFQAAVVPAAQIIGGMTGGVVGAGLGGAAGEALRQWQGEEKANVGKVLKEGVIGAGTQYLGGKVGELLTKGKTAGKVAEEGTKEATKKTGKLAKAGKVLKQNKFDIEAGIKKGDVFDADEIIKRQNILDNPEYGLSNANNAKAARAIKTNLYKTNKKIVEDALVKTTRVPDPEVLLSKIKSKIGQIPRTGTKAITDNINFYDDSIISAFSDNDIYKLDGTLRKLLDATLEKGAKVNTTEKMVNKIYHDVLNEYLQSSPEIGKAFSVMSDMHTITPVIGSGVKAAKAGVKIPVISKITGNLPGGDLIQTASTKAGNVLEKVGAGLPNISAGGLGLPPMVGSAVAPAMLIGAAAMQQPPEVQATGGLGAIPQNEGAAVSGITDITTPSIEGAATKTYVTGFSPEQLYQGYMKALSEGNKSAASQLKTMYSDEVAYQKTQGKAGGKAIPSSQVTELADMKTSLEMTKKMANDIGMGKGVFGPIIGRARSINPYDPTAQIFQSEVMALAQNVGRALEGGVLRQEDVKKYLLILPKISDTKTVAKGKLENVAKMLENKLKLRQAELEESGYTQEGTTTTEILPLTSEEY